MAKYDRLKKCKCQGCPLSVDVVTSRDGNGVCEFHDAAKAKDWMLVRDRVVEHQDFLIIDQGIKRLGSRYQPHQMELVALWLSRVRKDLKLYILNVGQSADAEHSMHQLQEMLRANRA